MGRGEDVTTGPRTGPQELAEPGIPGVPPGTGGAGASGAGRSADRVTPDPADADGPAARMFAADAASRGLGMTLQAVGEGTARVGMTVTGAMVNGHGNAHGGFLFTLADTAFACACNSYGPQAVGAAADIVFVAPAREGDVLTAHAVERTRFGRSGVYDVRITRDDQVVAEFRGHSRVIRAVEG
ncbi:MULTISPECIES: hydroxyphenylacetyl-CoA thioesterase PaaI [Streptomyces]|uniref:Hydroxyphenylacetyl-CoA thioesterase PaaI n=1 Tax=Streptomyces koyangensis TaxID=188770 RepID=A0A385DAI5_9ACTN|nr:MULTISPECIES: hydroxyphenylacetyl-CoA thioesterase PaaI [Streptomyces]AXQ55356.1 hydroxyphenylacetyl-CoA thioesterase PaaI [Streptomyces koyangensis]PKR43366.1 phenylacetic acid degradation protein PaaD [Streptomyces sp. EAG2]